MILFDLCKKYLLSTVFQRGFSGDSVIRIHLPMQEMLVGSLGREDPLEKEMATHFSTLAWKIPWTEEPGRLQSMGSQRVRLHFLFLSMSFLGGTNGKEPICQWSRQNRLGFSPWVGNIPWRRKWQPTSVLLPGKFHGQRSLVGYSPWGHKELDTTEQLSTHLYTHTQSDITLSCT